MGLGFGYPLKAFRYVQQHRMMKTVMTPMLIGAVIYVLVFIAAVYWSDDISDWIWARPDTESWWNWLLMPVWVLFRVAMRVLLIGLSMIIFLVVSLVAAAPYNSLLSEKVEADKLGTEEVPFTAGRALKEILYTLKDLLAYLGFFLMVSILLLMLNLIPLVGNIASLILGWGFTTLLLSLEFLDYPLARRHIPFGEKWNLVWRNKALCIGFGSAVFVFLLIPVFGLFLMPFACVGGTLMFCDMVKAGVPLQVSS